MTNPWFRDPRTAAAEVDAFEAEQAERRGDPRRARELYVRAGEALAAVSLSVSPDHPNTRSDIAISAVACLARGGELGRALEHAQRMLAEPDALSEHGRRELRRSMADYGSLIPHLARPVRSTRNEAVRAAVRGQFARPKAA